MIWNVAPHSGNEWRTKKDGTEVISNAVFQMTCQYKQLRTSKEEGVQYTVQWHVGTNAVIRYEARTGIPMNKNITIATNHQLFPNEETAQRYIKQIKTKYASYFRILNPGILTEYIDPFLLDGKLCLPFHRKKSSLTKS